MGLARSSRGLKIIRARDARAFLPDQTNAKGSSHSTTVGTWRRVQDAAVGERAHCVRRSSAPPEGESARQVLKEAATMVEIGSRSSCASRRAGRRVARSDDGTVDRR
jgi:hypothetical protein